MQWELVETMHEDALRVYAPERRDDVAELWRWRAGVAFAIIAQKGGAVGEDVVVPLDRLADIAEETVVLGERHDLVSLSFGHAGDGNIHVTFLHTPEDKDEAARVHAATAELYDFVLGLNGSLAGEHGVGWLKRGALEKQLDPEALVLHRKLKQVFDPKGLLNPGKKG